MDISRTTQSTPLQFCLALARASASLSRRFDGRLGTWHGISLGDLAILLELRDAADGRLRRVDLAERLGVTASGVTRALMPLEKIGLVTRKADTSDARVSFAALTAAGRRRLEEALESAHLIGEEIVPGSHDACMDVFDRIAGRDRPRP